jgi:hypothetical protein
VFARSGLGAPPGQTYQEVYPENGRWYGTFKKGKYMFPIDEVRLPICFCHPCRAQKLILYQERARETGRLS